MLTDTDNKIIEFVELYGGITINQASNIYFNTKYGYDTARRRLKALFDNGYLKADRDFLSDKLVYYTHKKPSSHQVLLLDFYSKLMSLGAEVLSFKREYKVFNTRADGMMIFKHRDKAKIILIEIDINNKTKVDKYQKAYESLELQSKFGTFPIVVIVSRKERKDIKERRGEGYKMVNVDYKFNGIELLL